MKLVEITSIKNYEYTGKVHDLEIEEDHSYNINGIIVHNSDYVMLGSMFNKSFESCGGYWISGSTGQLYETKEKYALDLFNNGSNVYKKFRGMSTKEVQKEWGKENLTTSEGISTFNKVEYTLEKFVENFTDYLKTAMSYTNSKTLEEFKESEYEIISQNSFERFNK